MLNKASKYNYYMIPPFDPGYWNAGIDMVVRSYDPTPIGGPSFGMPMPEYISNHIPCGETAFERWQRLDFGYPSNSGREMIDVNALNYPHDRPMDPFRDLTPSIPSIPSIPEIRLPWEPSRPEPVYMPVYEPPRIDISAAIIKEPAYKLPVYEPLKTDISFFLKPEPSLSSLLKRESAYVPAIRERLAELEKMMRGPEPLYVPATPAYEPRLDFTSAIHAYEPVKPLSDACSIIIGSKPIIPVYEPPKPLVDIASFIPKTKLPEPISLPEYKPPKLNAESLVPKIELYRPLEIGLGSPIKTGPYLDLPKTKPYPTIEVAPIVRSTGLETVFGGAGHSHFSYVRDQGFHVTTQIPGFGRNEGLPGGLSLHDPVKGMFPLLDKFR